MWRTQFALVASLAAVEFEASCAGNFSVPPVVDARTFDAVAAAAQDLSVVADVIAVVECFDMVSGEGAVVVEAVALQEGAGGFDAPVIHRGIQLKTQVLFGEDAAVVVQGVAVGNHLPTKEQAVRLVVGAFLAQVQGVLAGDVAADNQCAGAQFTAVINLAVGNLQAACTEDFGILAVNQPRGIYAVVGAAEDLSLVVDAAAVLEFGEAVGDERAVVVELAAL